MATITVNGVSYTVDSTAILLSSSSHPTLGLQEVHIAGTLPIPEGSGVVTAATIGALNGTSKDGVNDQRDANRKNFRVK